jgi:hypothetical protein
MIYDLNFNSKPYENKKGSLRLYSYIPLHLFFKRRYKLYSLLENRIGFSYVYFYKYSLKDRNTHKTGMFATYSRNLNMISALYFRKRSCFKDEFKNSKFF